MWVDKNYRYNFEDDAELVISTIFIMKLAQPSDNIRTAVYKCIFGVDSLQTFKTIFQRNSWSFIRKLNTVPTFNHLDVFSYVSYNKITQSWQKISIIFESRTSGEYD